MHWAHIQDEAYAWRQGAENKALPELKPATTHQLRHDPITDRWSCGCGYTLGDGREAFLALCPLRSQRKCDVTRVANQREKRRQRSILSPKPDKQQPDFFR